MEERDGSNVVTKRFYNEGEQIGGAAYFYNRDHLGSVRELTDGSGAIQARYQYDPYGRATKTGGTMDVDFQYAGYYAHILTGLNLTHYRTYDSDAGRWLSRDLGGEGNGINLYEYVQSMPINAIDRLGLCGCPPPGYAGSQTGNAALDTDGSGNPAADETSHDLGTSYEPGGKPLNGDVTPYVAQNVNAGGKYTYPVGTPAYVVNNVTGVGASAILGDNATPSNNPKGRLEVSTSLAAKLGVAQYNSKGQILNSTNENSLTAYYYPKGKSGCP